MGHTLQFGKELAEVLLDHRVSDVAVGLTARAIVQDEDQNPVQHQHSELVFGLLGIAWVGDVTQLAQ